MRGRAKGKKDWSRASLPIGSLRIRYSGKSRVRYIKVRLDGPKQKRWIEYARWLWLKHKGPIPDGKRIAHLDGDTLNDSIENLGAVAPGDVLWIHCHANDQKSAANYAACRAATADHNRQRREIRRGRGLLNRNQWYLVDEQQQTIYLTDCRSRIQAVRLAGHEGPLPKNGHIKKILARLPFAVRRGLELDDPQFKAFSRLAWEC